MVGDFAFWAGFFSGGFAGIVVGILIGIRLVPADGKMVTNRTGVISVSRPLALFLILVMGFSWALRCREKRKDNVSGYVPGRQKGSVVS